MTKISATDRVVLVKVSKTAGLDSTPEELYDAVRKWWRVAEPRRDGSELSPTHALAVVANTVVAAYRIAGWNGPSDGRWAFSGLVDERLTQRYHGADVSEYFPKGAQYPLRYVNCPPLMVIDRSEQRDDGVEEFEKALRLLDDEPLAAIMLGQRELFHSNFIAWYFRHFPNEADSIFQWGPSHRTGATERAVLREHLNIDIWMDWPDGHSVAIENKVFSLPDHQQLRAYAGKIQLKRPGARMILLSLLNPQWSYDQLETSDGTWDFWSYSRLAMHLRDRHQGKRDYSSQIVLHYADMVDALATVVARCTSVAEDDSMDLPDSLGARISSSQLLGTVRKMRMRNFAACLHNDLATHLDTDVTVNSGFGAAGPILTAWIPLETSEPLSPRVGIQLQGHQFRKIAILPRLHSNTGGSAELRAHWGQHNERLFDFSEDLCSVLHAERAVMPAGPAAFNKYEPDFIYRYVKAPGVTYSRVLAATLHVFSDLLMHQINGMP